jgi:phage terminase large subunit GpA-like protein
MVDKMIQAAMSPIVRPMSQWAEEEIWIPTGEHKGKRFSHSRHPASRIWFRELDSGRWWRTALVAPTQNGKTFMGYVIPVLYHLFELNEPVIIGLPDMRMANDKWRRDFLPVIEASRYSDLLPVRGEGSRGGDVKSNVAFANGTMLRFMSKGGSDKARAGLSGVRVAAITETDGMDDPGERSREADACTQIAARLRGFAESHRRVYLECTASIPEGKIWTEYTHGTQSKLVRPCPYCKAWVCPERDHLKGWQDCEDEETAREKSAWHCPECDHAWTQADREWGWARMLLVHNGQEVAPDGEIIGKPPRTRTLGFRWGAIDNPFTNAGTCGAEEWRGARSKDKEGAEREILQFTNAKPYSSPDLILEELELDDIESKEVALKRGIIPPNCIGIALAIDTHARILYWEGKAVVRNPETEAITLHVFDHATLDLDKTKLAKEAIIEGLKKLKRQFDLGWIDEAGRKWSTIPGENAAQVWIDSSYPPHQKAVYTFCAMANKGLGVMQAIWRPVKGYGESQPRMSAYHSPEAKSEFTLYVGNDYHIRKPKPKGNTKWFGVQLVHVNTDTWKSTFHQGFTIEPGQQGSITLFQCETSDRDVYSSQIRAEVLKQQVLKGRGVVQVWRPVTDHAQNHYLDCGYMATTAADFLANNAERLGGTPKARKKATDYVNRPSAATVAAKYASRPMAVAMK